MRIYISGLISHELYGPFINQITSSISLSRKGIRDYYCIYQIMNSFCGQATLSEHGLAEKLPYQKLFYNLWTLVSCNQVASQSTWIKNGSAAMLAAKKSAGVAPEVNLRNPLHAGDKACKWGFHSGFETWGELHQKSKTGISVAPQKGRITFKIPYKKQSCLSNNPPGSTTATII